LPENKMYNTEILASLGHEKEHCRETPLPYATIAGAWPQRRPCKKALPEIDLIDGGSHAMRQVHTLYARYGRFGMACYCAAALPVVAQHCRISQCANLAA
jgi:hypothetical protein